MKPEVQRIVSRFKAAYAFDEMTSGKAVTFTAYRWDETPEKSRELIALFDQGKLRPGLYVVDTPKEWGGPYANSLVKMKVRLKKPFVLNKDNISLEQRINQGPGKFLSILKRNGYDSVVSTVKNKVVGTRQALLFRPNEQIETMTVVTPSRKLVARFKTAEILTKEWLMGVRRGWLKLIDPPIGDWDDVHKAYRNLGLFVKNLNDQVFYARRGPYTGSPTMSEGKKVQDLLEKLSKAIEELKSRAKHWQAVQEGRSLPGFHQEDGERMLNLYRTNFPGANEVALESSSGKWRNVNPSDLMDKVLKILREDAKRIRDHDEANPNDPYQDRGVYKEFDLHGLKVVIDDSTVLPSEIHQYIKYLDEAYQRLKQKGFGKVWYGTVFIKCEKCGGTNQYGPELGVGGNYPIGPDVVNIFERPSKFIVELMAHELGHRYWFKFMSQAQRGKFEELINIKPLDPAVNLGRIIPDSKVEAAKTAVDSAFEPLEKLLKDFGSSKLQWWPDILKRFDEPLVLAASQVQQNVITAFQKLDSWIDTPEVRKLHEEALKATGDVRKMVLDMSETLKRKVLDVPEPSDPPQDSKKYWMNIFRPMQKWWIEDAEITIEGAITAAYIYIDASVQAFNENESKRDENAYKQWEEKKREMERRVSPVSDYGGKHISEAWAEAFAHYVLDKDMTRDQIESFKEVLKRASENVIRRYLMARSVKVDQDFIEGLRRDFLTLMKNLPRVTDYRTGAQLREGFIVYKNQFKDFFFDRFLNEYKANGDTRFEGLRKPAWDFYLELSIPLGYPDDYYSEEARFINYEREVKTWEPRLRAKAQKFWKAAKDALSYQSSPVEVEVHDRDRLVLEGFQVELVGYEPNSTWQDEALYKFKEALKRYRRNAAKTVPWLLKHQLPLEASFKSKLDEGGRYRGRDIYIALSAVGTGSVDEAVKILAHEMGHHMFKLLSGPAAEFWSSAIRQDYGPLRLFEVLRQWPESMRWSSDFVQMMAEKDPVLALQVDVISWGHGNRSKWEEREDFQAAFDSGTMEIPVPKSPITGYGGKNPEEAFCEAIGLLVAYGPRAVLPIVKHWLDQTVPGEVKLASRVLARYRTLLGTADSRFAADRVADFVDGFYRRHPKLKRYTPSKVLDKSVSSGGHGEARQHGDEVWLFSKFWSLDQKTKDFVFAHELGHLVSSRKGLQSIMKAAENSGIDPWDASALPFGQFNVDEAFADSFASYFLEPRELFGRYPKWVKLIEAVL